MTDLVIPAFIRGTLVDDDLVSFPGRGVQASLQAPDPQRLADRLPLGDPLRMRDLYDLSVEDVVEVLAEVGPRLKLDGNELLQEALAQSSAWSDMTPSVLEASYGQLPGLFTPESVLGVAERSIGIRFLDGWGDVGGAAVRAFGARAVHVIAGNSPIIAAITIVRNAITRGDAIVKSPSNDPLTALAIARTMAEVAPGNPLVRHLSVAYWKGGDERFEARLYQPRHVEKIVAWGGFASVKHVTRYVQPGLELISLDPKLSATVVGAEAFADDASMAETARLAAADVGVLNQLGCFNARVIYVATGTHDAGLKLANRWGTLLYDAIVGLPPQVSTPPRDVDGDLRQNIRALHTWPDFYTVVGGRDDEGAVVVSQLGDPVDFHTTLAGRVANVVPVDDPRDALRDMNAYTQTVGVYPDALKRELRDTMPLYGTQRLISLGYATHFRADLPQDGLEPTRRMVKWIVDETYVPERTHPLSHMVPGVAPWRARELVG
jgi:hypothetical protein